MSPSKRSWILVLAGLLLSFVKAEVVELEESIDTTTKDASRAYSSPNSELKINREFLNDEYMNERLNNALIVQRPNEFPSENLIINTNQQGGNNSGDQNPSQSDESSPHHEIQTSPSFDEEIQKMEAVKQLGEDLDSISKSQTGFQIDTDNISEFNDDVSNRITKMRYSSDKRLDQDNESIGSISSSTISLSQGNSTANSQENTPLLIQDDGQSLSLNIDSKDEVDIKIHNRGKRAASRSDIRCKNIPEADSNKISISINQVFGSAYEDVLHQRWPFLRFLQKSHSFHPITWAKRDRFHMPPVHSLVLLISADMGEKPLPKLAIIEEFHNNQVCISYYNKNKGVDVRAIPLRKVDTFFY